MFEIDVPFQKVIIFGIHNNFPGCSCWSMLMIVGLCHDFGSRVSSILLVVLMLWVRLVVSHVFLFVWENIYSSVFWGAEGDFSSWWGLMMGFSLQQMIWRWYHRFLQIGQDFTKRAADVHLSKRGAMEQLLYEAAAYTLGGDPELISSTTEKHEDGNTRLLLTSDTFNYIVSCLVLHEADRHLAKDSRIDYPIDLAEDWSGHTQRVVRSSGFGTSRTSTRNTRTSTWKWVI